MSGTTTLSITLVAYVLLRPASFFFFYRCGDHRDLHSFPTRRSSDLLGRGVRRRRRPCERAGDRPTRDGDDEGDRSEEHTSELQSHHDLVCRLLLEKKKKPSRRQRKVRRGSSFLLTTGRTM